MKKFCIAGPVDPERHYFVPKRLDYSYLKGLEQTARYVDTCGATEGHLVIFDRDPYKSWQDKIAYECITAYDKQIHIWQM